MTFERLFVPVALEAAVSDSAWLEAMLRVEQALGRARDAELEEDALIRRATTSSGSPRRVVPTGTRLSPVRALRERAGPRRTGERRARCTRHGWDAGRPGRDLARLRGARRRCGGVRPAGPGAPLDSGRGADPPAAGGADHVRLQGGPLARRAPRRPGPPGDPAVPGSARRRCRDTRRFRHGRARGGGAPRERARPRRAARSVAHEPGARLRARGRARSDRGRMRQDRARRRPARPGGSGGGGGGQRGRLLDDAAQAEPCPSRGCPLAHGSCTRTSRCSRPATTSSSVPPGPGRRRARARRRCLRRRRALQPPGVPRGSSRSTRPGCARTCRTTLSEARGLGLEGEYLGAAEELTDRIPARYEGRGVNERRPRARDAVRREVLGDDHGTRRWPRPRSAPPPSRT